MTINTNSIPKVPSYDTIYGLRETWEQLEHLSYKLESIDEVDEDVIAYKVIHIMHELIRG